MRDGIISVAYAPEHGAFVFGTFLDSLADAPSFPLSLLDYRRVLDRVLRDPRSRCVVAVPAGHPDDLLGWACAYDAALVFAYTRYVVRRKGVATVLVAELGLPIPLPVVYWTRACSRIAATGKLLYFDVDALERISKLVH